jgi:excisionase family DNA binding protein
MSTQYPQSTLPVIDFHLVTVKQAAEALQVSEKTIWNLMTAGKLSHVKIANTRRIPLDDLKRLATPGTAESYTETRGRKSNAEKASA